MSLYAQYGETMLHPDVREDWRRLLVFHFCKLSTNLVLSIFSHCSLSDTKNLVRVCKEWQRIVSMREYWMPHIYKAVMANGFVDWAPLIDPFIFQTLSLREQVGWLFDALLGMRKDRKETERSDQCRCHVIRYSPQMEMRFFMKKTGPRALISAYTSPRSLADGFLPCETWYPTPKKSGCLWICSHCNSRGDEDANQRRMTLSYKLHRPEPLFYLGEGIDKKPHGMGIWSTSLEDDDSVIILQGDNVAFDGLPHGVGTDGEGRAVEYWAGERVEREEGTNKRRKI